MWVEIHSQECVLKYAIKGKEEKWSAQHSQMCSELILNWTPISVCTQTVHTRPLFMTQLLEKKPWDYNFVRKDHLSGKEIVASLAVVVTG